MRSFRINRTLGLAALVLAPGFVAAQRAQADVSLRTPGPASDDTSESSRPAYSFSSRTDSIAWARNRTLAAKSNGYRLVVSLQDRHLWAIVGRDTVLSAPAGVAKGTKLEFGKA